jgi:four helix bundle protein
MPGNGNTKKSKTFGDLWVWQKAHGFVKAIYKITASFPKHQTYGLVSQMRRAAVSIPANIAEGFRRRGKGDKLRFMNIAQASLEESRYYLILAKDLRYANTDEILALLEEVSCMLEAYCQAIHKSGCFSSDF